MGKKELAWKLHTDPSNGFLPYKKLDPIDLFKYSILLDKRGRIISHTIHISYTQLSYLIHFETNIYISYKI